MNMFVFTFGDCGYDEQHAVVMAETLEEATGLLLADMKTQRAQAPRWEHDPERINPNWQGREGYSTSQHTAERIEEATREGKPPRAVAGSIVYLIGVDG